MKRKIFTALTVCWCLVTVPALLSGCSASSGTGGSSQTSKVTVSYSDRVPEDFSVDSEKVDDDLTAMDNETAYQTLCQMISAPDEYIGRTVKIHGELEIYHDDLIDQPVYALMVHDGDGCCEQGIEFELSDGSAYPEEGTHMVIAGVLTEYTEGESTLTLLKNCVLIETHSHHDHG